MLTTLLSAHPRLARARMEDPRVGLDGIAAAAPTEAEALKLVVTGTKQFFMDTYDKILKGLNRL